jgi:hypothetical protein
MITGTSLLVFGFTHDEPTEFSRKSYLYSSVDSIKVTDSVSVKLIEPGEYSRDDFNILLKKFCNDKPISPEELIENRPVLK